LVFLAVSFLSGFPIRVPEVIYRLPIVSVKGKQCKRNSQKSEMFPATSFKMFTESKEKKDNASETKGRAE
jgi:hypothetical protein